MSKIRIWELSHDLYYAPLINTMHTANNNLIQCLKDLSVKTDLFEEFDIKVQTQDSQKN